MKISPKFVLMGPIENNTSLVQIMAWRRPGHKPLSWPMTVRLPTHICATRPQWVKMSFGQAWLRRWLMIPWRRKEHQQPRYSTCMEYILHIFLVVFTQKLKHKKAVNNDTYAACHISTGRKFYLAQSIPSRTPSTMLPFFAQSFCPNRNNCATVPCTEIQVRMMQSIRYSMMTSSNENISALLALCVGKSPVTKASDAELWCFLWSAPWINGWVNNSEVGDLRRHRAHYDVIVMDNLSTSDRRERTWHGQLWYITVMYGIHTVGRALTSIWNEYLMILSS